MSASRVLLIVFGSLIALIGLALAVGGAIALIAHGTGRDDDGFFSTSTERFATPGYALVSEEVDLGEEEAGRGPVDLGDLAEIRVRAESASTERPVFAGIGPQEDVEAYLAGVARDELVDVETDPFRARYRSLPGDRRPAPPGGEGFWVAQASGPGVAAFGWELTEGRWTFVVMNAGATPGVEVDLQLGVRIGILLALGIGLLAGGVVLLGAGTTMIVFGARGGGGGGPPPAGPAPAHAGDPAGGEPAVSAYPLRIEGDPDAALSRWLWLVKWLLAIPHYIVVGIFGTGLWWVGVWAGDAGGGGWGWGGGLIGVRGSSPASACCSSGATRRTSSGS